MINLYAIPGDWRRQLLGFLRICFNFMVIPLIFNFAKSVNNSMLLLAIASFIGFAAVFFSFLNSGLEMSNACNMFAAFGGLLFMGSIIFGTVPALFFAKEMYAYGTTLTNAQYGVLMFWLLGGAFMDSWHIDLCRKYQHPIEDPTE